MKGNSKLLNSIYKFRIKWIFFLVFDFESFPFTCCGSGSRNYLCLLLFACLPYFTWVAKFQISNWVYKVEIWIFVWFLKSILWDGSWIYLAYDFSCMYLWDIPVHVRIAQIELMNSHLTGNGRFRVKFSKVTDESRKDLQYHTMGQKMFFFFFFFFSYHDQTESNPYYISW